MRLVLDASVVLKWYVPEVDSEVALALRSWIQAHVRQVLVPEFFYIEAASILWKKQVLRHELSSEMAHDMLGEIQRLSFHGLEDETLLSPAYALAETYRVTPYDALYLVAAVEENCPFVTADQELIQKLKTHPHSGSFISLANWEILK